MSNSEHSTSNGVDPLSTPVMNPIREEASSQFSDQLYKTPYGEAADDISLSDSASKTGNSINNNTEALGTSTGPGRSRIKARSLLMSPTFARPNSMYSQRDGNNSSSSLIYNPTFTFGGNNTTTTNEQAFHPGNNVTKTPVQGESRRNSLKYIPGTKLAPPTSRNRSPFQVWSTGTITFPFGLNRVDVLLSFGLAVSLCFVGLDLVFHIIEESIVLLVETRDHSSDTHSDIEQSIPHSHHGSSEPFTLVGSDYSTWYLTLLVSIALSTLSLYKIYYSNTNSKLKTKNPLITISYGFYLMVYPVLANQFYNFSDYIATIAIAFFILLHGLKIAEWTGVILLMGLSTTSLPPLALIDKDEESSTASTQETVSERISSLRRNRSNTLNAFQEIDDKTSGSRIKKMFGILHEHKTVIEHDASKFKSAIFEKLENLPEYKAKCKLEYQDLIVTKVNFNLYVVLMKVNMKGASNDEELHFRLAFDKCIKSILPGSETTIEIERL
ncbi:Protein ZRG17 [Nakaseomyces glabratus]|nr:Protein ZRG17 [Nakaseomyces glabratus]